MNKICHYCNYKKAGNYSFVFLYLMQIYSIVAMATNSNTADIGFSIITLYVNPFLVSGR